MNKSKEIVPKDYLNGLDYEKELSDLIAKILYIITKVYGQGKSKRVMKKFKLYLSGLSIHGLI